MEALLLRILETSFGAAVAIGAIYLAVVAIRSRKKNSAEPDEVSGVISVDHLPVTAGQCRAIHAVNDAKFEMIKTSLAETGTRVEKIDTKLDGMRDSQTEALSEMRTAVAVLKDRTNRRD